MMNKTTAIFCVLAFGLPNVHAQNYIGYEANGLRAGDSLRVVGLPYVDAGDSGCDCLWDFSGLTAKGMYTAWLMTDSAGQNMLIGKGCNYAYRMSEDSLLVSAYEDPQTYICFDVPKLGMVYPLHLGDSLCSPFSGKGLYCGRHHLWRMGMTQLEVDGEGRLVLAEGDTLNNVLRVYALTTASVRTSTDSVLTDSASFQQHIEERYLWYARGHRYPVFEVMTSTLYDDMKPVYTEQWSRSLQLTLDCAVTDSVNSEVLHTDSLTAIDRETEEPICYTFTCDGSHVNISYNLSVHARVHVIIADFMGVAHRNLTDTHDAGEGYEMSIGLNGLRRGQYIVYINANGKVYNHKIEVN